MAEERNLGTVRAPETATDEDLTKEELQRRMEEARESITQTVEEIKETVATQYQSVKETISQSLDWREQFRRRPVPFTLGAFGTGFIVGYSIGGVLVGDRETSETSYAEDEEEDDTVSLSSEGILPQAAHPARSYAAQAITGGAYGSSASAQSAPASESAYTRGTPEPAASSQGTSAPAPDYRPSYSSGYTEAAEAEPEKPGLFERFKETKAYDRLQAELSTMGERAVEELSKTAQNVVLPALLAKVKDLIGIDLSTQREVAQRSRLEQQASTASAGAAQSAQSPTGGTSGSGSSGSQGGASSYATSENRGYGQS